MKFLEKMKLHQKVEGKMDIDELKSTHNPIKKGKTKTILKYASLNGSKNTFFLTYTHTFTNI